MPKQKSHSGAKKRFLLTNSGRLKRAKQGHRHILTKKTAKRKINLRKTDYVSKEFDANIRTLIGA